MEPIKITAQMATPVALFDDWSPAMDGLLEWLLLDRLGLTSPNPTPKQVEECHAIVNSNMPIAKGTIGGKWYWQVSSPCYVYSIEQQDRFRKRWQPGTDSPEPEWGKRKQKWNTSEGGEKAYDLPLYLRSIDSITWYAVGNVEGVLSLVESCSGIGNKRSIGNGQITRWTIESTANDWHLFGKNGELMRPIPCELLPDNLSDFTVRDWGWRPPAWLLSNKSRCAMPIHTVRKKEC